MTAGETFAESEREPTFFTLKEKYPQVRRPLSDEEKKGGFNAKRPWKQETQATGLLQFAIETRLHPATEQIRPLHAPARLNWLRTN